MPVFAHTFIFLLRFHVPAKVHALRIADRIIRIIHYRCQAARDQIWVLTLSHNPADL
jgi:hypothetical protein